MRFAQGHLAEIRAKVHPNAPHSSWLSPAAKGFSLIQSATLMWLQRTPPPPTTATSPKIWGRAAPSGAREGT